jgi:GntR family transcriptional repressor for pyruvate dehydrogenase complex
VTESRPAPSERPPSPTRSRGRISIANEITELLRRQIVSGDLTRGDRLPTEKALAAQFEVSQPTIREAVRALDAMGLVDVRHGSGTYVTGDSGDLLSQPLRTMLQFEDVGMGEILDVRQSLGVLTATLAAVRASDSELLAIAQAQQGCEQFVSNDPVGFTDRYMHFLDALATGAHNPLVRTLEMTLGRLMMQFQMKAFADRPIEFWQTRRAALNAGRTKLVAALIARDVEGTRLAVESYHTVLRERTVHEPEFAKFRISDLDSVAPLTNQPGYA